MKGAPSLARRRRSAARGTDGIIMHLDLAMASSVSLSLPLSLSLLSNNAEAEFA